MVIRETCRCGSRISVEHEYGPMAEKAVQNWRRLHRACRALPRNSGQSLAHYVEKAAEEKT